MLNRVIFKKGLRRGFSEAVSLHQQKYKNLQQILKSQKQEIEADFEAFKADKKTSKNLNPFYKHPYDLENNPINETYYTIDKLFVDIAGPEQVSPHYETFTRSRKFMLFFTAYFSASCYFMNVSDLAWVVQSMVPPVLFQALFYYVFFEGRKFLGFPFQVQWYNAINENELMEYWQGEVEDKEDQAYENIQKCFQQLEYIGVHQDFKKVKFESVSRFLVNQEQNLKTHVKKRAVNLLKNAEKMENKNQQEIIKKIMNIASQKLQEIQSKVPQNVEDAAFEAALDGISTGKMDYKKDIIINELIQAIRNEVKKIQNLSPEEMKKLIALTENQIKSLQQMDKQARQEYLKKQPAIEQAIKEREGIKEKISSW